MNRILLFTIFLIFGSFLHAQTRISGRIIDKNTQEPLSFAQIRGLESQLGTLSNEEGYYSLNLGRNSTDTFAVSHIGYEYFKIPVSQIKNPDNFDILLTARIVELDEVVIIPQEPLELIKQAIASIDENYGHDPMNMQGFYRELISQNDTFVEFNEAIVDIYKLPNQLEETVGNQVKLLKGRSLSEGEKFETVQFNMGAGGPNSIISKPVIATPVGMHFLEQKHFKNYEYVLDGITTYNDRDVYKIIFDQKRKLRQKLYAGTIYLDVKSLAFVSIDFKLSEKGKKFRLGKVIGMKGRMAMTLMKTFGFDLIYQEETGRQDFVYHRGRWYLNYSRHDVHGKITLPKRSDMPGDIRITALREMAITKMEPNRSEQFPPGEQLKNDQPIPDQIGEYDEGFWENYNFLKPTDSLTKIADDMKKGDN